MLLTHAQKAAPVPVMLVIMRGRAPGHFQQSRAEKENHLGISWSAELRWIAKPSTSR